MTATTMLDLTRPGKVLTVEQKRHYEKEGYIVVRNAVPVSEIEKYRQRFQELCEAEHPPKTMTIMRDITIAKSEFKKGDSKNITKVQDFATDPVLFSYCKYRPICDIVGDIIGQNSLVAMHTMLINKPPDSGNLTSRHPLHQDLQYFPFRPADSICCAWTAMEKITRANGCLVVVPGTHKGELLEHGYPEWEGGVNKAYHGILSYSPDMPRLHVEMEAGDTVFFHPILIHGSGVNRTAGFRKAISCHYANGDICKYVDLKGTTAEFTSNEIVEMAKKKFASYGMTDVEVDFADIWRFRARAVNGSRGNL